MPLNKLENFIKNSEGRILYVNPNDLDATDGIENQGNSLTKPFKTLQRALIESARFSYLKGSDNDIVEKTTILLFPGEHLIDNRPGFGVKSVSGNATAISPSGAESGAQNTLTLTLNSNFDLTQEDNLLYKFNSTEGGVIVPRGTSIVGLDLRKTKVRPKYVPNPTDAAVKRSAIFRVTGACYFWQFSIFDGDDSTLVYTDPTEFTNNQSKPIFSHHKLAVFEYADGVNKLDQFDGLTDLDVYYSKLSNAYNRASIRDIDEKYPAASGGFAKQRPEYEIVGAFSSDRIQITDIISGDGNTAGPVVTVTTAVPHELSGGTPIKIEKVNELEYNISTKVQNVLNETQFTYLLPQVPVNLAAGPASGLSAGSAEVSVEVDTVTGASPYIFNCSLRSVFGMQGMRADGAKATGFKSMVVAQFTGISLQKDDRAFTKYNPTSRKYESITYQKTTGSALSKEASSLEETKVYHLDKDAVYRDGWKTAHITLENDAVFQIVSVFAIGYHIHFLMKSGGDSSITNSNSNFGQFALAADGFKKESFDKDNKGYITSIITPKAVVSPETTVELTQLDSSVNQDYDAAATNPLSDGAPSTTKLYLLGQDNINVSPTDVAQGFRIGSRFDEKIYIDELDGETRSSVIRMSKKVGTLTVGGVDYDQTETVEVSSEKEYEGVHNDTTSGSANSIHKITLVNKYGNVNNPHDLNNGESIRIIAENGDLPEGLDPHTVYYAITNAKDGTRLDGVTLSGYEIQIASSKTNAERTTPLYIKTISSPAAGKLKIISRVSDKKPGEFGHPMQFEAGNNGAGNPVLQWFIHVSATDNGIYDKRAFLDENDEDIPYIQRRTDDRSLDDKLYKVRYVIPKELQNARDPSDSFVIQDSSSTNSRFNADFTRTSIGSTDYDFNRNLRFISHIDFNTTTKIVTVRSDKSHDLNAGEQIIVQNITDTINTSGAADKGYNGTFLINSVISDKVFTYKTTDVLGNEHLVGTYNNDTNIRSTALPRFQRNDNKENLFVYRSETIAPYIEGAQDGVFHLYILNGNNPIEEEFTDAKYNQNVVNLYPQLDRDNVNDNPQEATTYAKRFPIGDVVTNDLKKSLTRETANKLLNSFGAANTVSSVVDNTTNAVLTFTREHNFNGLKYGGTLVGGSGHTQGTYYNVKLFDDSSAPNSAKWRGATAKVVVNSSGAVTSYEITEPGSGYKSSLSPLYFDSSLPSAGGIGGAPSANITIADANISLATGDYVQVTGISTGADHYFRIKDIPLDPSSQVVPIDSTVKIEVHKTASDIILDGQSVIGLGLVTEVSGTPTHVGSTQVSTITTTKAHGLSKGNRFTVLNASDVKEGDFIVEEVKTVTQFTAVTSTAGLTAPKYILKHGMGANNANSGKGGEFLSARGLSLYDNESLILVGSGDSNQPVATTDTLKVTLPDGSTTAESIQSRFQLGCFVQVDSEIMRVIDKTIGAQTTIKVLRGALGTIVEDHGINSIIKKIRPLPVELRRPSILRASGHTFEYLGYGPGNYSTGLPQVQLKTLTEREEFLSQSQETSCGTVVYTGMNDKGDFYIGNTKISSDSGEQITFDIPVPTVTGEDPSTLSVVFDEVIIKNRLLVEGGPSQQILSQFNGPVTFNGNVRFNKDLRITKKLTVDGIAKFTKGDSASTDANACSLSPAGGVIIEGGISIGNKLSSAQRAINVLGGNVYVCNENDSTSATTGSIFTRGGIGIAKKLYVGTESVLVGEVTVNTGIIPDADEGAYLGSTAKPFAEAHIGEVRIGPGTNDGEIDTATGNLRLDSAGGTVEVDDNLTVTGTNLTTLGAIGNPISTVVAKVNGSMEVTGDITAFASSDLTLKENVNPIIDALQKVNLISGNTYDWNNTSPREGSETGVIAQEIKQLGLPGVVKLREDNTYGVRYERLVPLLIEAIKELSSKVDALS
tara:strand:- start:2096 stop:7852 length:5757 start_codon:yes stop_codon:yes gene_type:complete